jgi:DNA-binding IclR family transcriptional regulator
VLQKFPPSGYRTFDRNIAALDCMSEIGTSPPPSNALGVGSSDAPAVRHSDPTGSLNRAALLVRAIARGAGAGAALTELVARTGLPRPTIHRVLATLLEIGWVERDAGTKRFHLGAEFLTLGIVASARHPIERVAASELGSLAQEIDQTVYLIVRAGLDGVCVARQESASRIQTLVLKLGSQVPLGWGAGGMAILAALPQAEADQVIRCNLARYAQMPFFDEEAFGAAMRGARGHGFASHDGLFAQGIGGIGVAVLDRSSYPIAAISTAFVSDWLDEAQRLRCAARLKETAERIATRLVEIGGVRA